MTPEQVIQKVINDLREEWLSALAPTLERPDLYMAQLYKKEWAEEAIDKGWQWGIHSWVWDKQGWFKDIGRKMHLPLVAWGKGEERDDHFKRDGVGLTHRGEMAVNQLRELAKTGLVGVVTVEFENGKANLNHGQPGYIEGTEQWVLDTWELAKETLGEIGLGDVCYAYRTNHPSADRLAPRVSRLFYPYLRPKQGVVNAKWGGNNWALRQLAAWKSLPEIEDVGAYIQGHVGSPIGPKRAWDNWSAVVPAYGHHLRQLAACQRFNPKWLTYYTAAMNNKVFFDAPGWTELVNAADDWMEGKIRVNDSAYSQTKVVTR